MRVFETKAFLMKVHDDLFIEFLVKDNVNLQASDVWESRDLSVNYIPNKKFFVLFLYVEIMGEKNIAKIIELKPFWIIFQNLTSPLLHNFIIFHIC